MSSAAGPMSSRLTDEQLGRAALAGDREAFTELFGRHEGGLYNVALRLTGDREDAADITQEAFLRVFARLDELAGREVNLAAYLHRTARNLVYDRSAGRAREAPVAEVERVAGADEGMEADPELTTLVAAQGRDVQAANARLPERHRLVLALRELEDMSYDDIGRVLDVTPGAVAQLLSRARLALRRELRREQVDVAALAPGCRARLGDIGALIDGELGPDRAQALSVHMSSCESCRASRAAFEDARVTYRAWLPLPVLGLGAATARAAEGRGLVRFADAPGGGGPGGGPQGPGGPGGPAPGGRAGPGGDGRGRRRRRAGLVLAAILALLLLVGVPALVAVRSGSGDPAPVAAPAAPTPTAAAAAPTPAAPAPATTAPAATAAPPTAAAQAPPPGASPRDAPAGTAAAAAAEASGPAPAARRAPARTAAPPATTRAPATTAEPPPPPETTTVPPAVTDPPPRPPGPDDPTFTVPTRPRPPIVTLPPVITIPRDPTPPVP